jgi:hypothetical protein
MPLNRLAMTIAVGVAGSLCAVVVPQSSSGSSSADCAWAVYMSTDYIAGLGVSLVYG